MADPQAWKGDYVDVKFIKGRKVAQIWIEIPLEAATDFVAAFGAPNPAFGVPVALARIDQTAKPERKGGKLAQRAGILCNEGAFWTFLYETHDPDGVKNSLEAADWVRQLCGVTTRAELDHDEGAASRFKELEASYKAWLSVPA